MTTLTYTSPLTDRSPPTYLGHLQSSADIEDFLIALERPPTVSIKRSRRRQIFVVPPEDRDPRLALKETANAEGAHISEGPRYVPKTNQLHVGPSQSLGGQTQLHVEGCVVISDPGPPMEQTPRVTQTYSKKKKKFAGNSSLQHFEQREAREQKIPPVDDKSINEDAVLQHNGSPNMKPENSNPAENPLRTPQKSYSTRNCPPKQKKKSELKVTKTADTQNSMTVSRIRRERGMEIDREASLKRKHGVKSPKKDKVMQHKRRRRAPVSELALADMVPEHGTLTLLREAETDPINVTNAPTLHSVDIESAHPVKGTKTTKAHHSVLQRKKFIVSVDGFKYKYPSYTTPKHHGNVHWQPGSGFDEHVIGDLYKNSMIARTCRLPKTGKAQHIRTGILDLTAHIGVSKERTVIPPVFHERETSAKTRRPDRRCNHNAEIPVKQGPEGENVAGIQTAVNDQGQEISTQTDQPAGHDLLMVPNITQQEELLLDEDFEDMSITCEEFAKAARLASPAPVHHFRSSQVPSLTENSVTLSKSFLSSSASQPFLLDNKNGSQRKILLETPMERRIGAPHPAAGEMQSERIWKVSKPVSSRHHIEVMEDIDDDIDLAQPSSYHLSQRRRSYWPFGADPDFLEDYEGMMLVSHAKRIPAEVLETQERRELMDSVELGPEHPIENTGLDAGRYFSRASGQLAGQGSGTVVRAANESSQASIGGLDPSHGRTQEAFDSQLLTQPETKIYYNSNRPNSSRVRAQAGQTVVSTERRTLETLTRQASIELGTMPGSRRKSTNLPFVPPLKVNGTQRTLSSQTR